MDLFDRIYCLHRILRQARYPVPRHDLQERLECSRATIIRIIRDMWDCLGAPIEYDRDASGYHYNRADGQPYELPGLWFNPSELHALLTVQRLLSELQPGLLESHIAPLRRYAVSCRVQVRQTSKRPTRGTSALRSGHMP